MKGKLGYIMTEDYSVTTWGGGYDPGYVEPVAEALDFTGVVRPTTIEADEAVRPVDSTSPILQTMNVPGTVSDPIPVPDPIEADIPTTVPVYQAGEGVPAAGSGNTFLWLLLLAGALLIVSKRKGK